VKTNKRIAFSLFFVLLGLSFLKDDFTPDFLNSTSAHFLDPEYHVARFTSIKTEGLFWFAAILYSFLFIYFPYKIIHFYFENAMLTKFTLLTLTAMCTSIYVMIFLNSHLFDHGIIPKINRYFHSPIMVLFFIASFTIIKSGNVKEK
jgi:hypothetical protein